MLLGRHVESRQRRFGAALALSLGLHALLAFLPVSPLRSGPQGADGGPGSPGLLGQFLAAALQGADVLLTSSEPVAAPQPLPETALEPLPAAPEPDPASDADVTTAPTEPVDSTAGSGAATGQAGTGDPAGGTGADGPPAPPAEVAIRPREYVHPRMPDIVRKRKIDDFVLLQVLVGTDGSVRDVRVLRTIPDCVECTASAVEAARRLRYNPVLVNGRLAEVWTVPFDFRFTQGR